MTFHLTPGRRSASGKQEDKKQTAKRGRSKDENKGDEYDNNLVMIKRDGKNKGNENKEGDRETEKDVKANAEKKGGRKRRTEG